MRIMPALTSSHERRSWISWLPREAEWAGQLFLLGLSFEEVGKGFELFVSFGFLNTKPIEKGHE